MEKILNDLLTFFVDGDGSVLIMQIICLILAIGICMYCILRVFIGDENGD